MSLLDDIWAGAKQVGESLAKGDTTGAIAGARKVTGAVYDDLGKNVGDLVSSGGNILEAAKKKRERDLAEQKLKAGGRADGMPGTNKKFTPGGKGSTAKTRAAGGGVFLAVRYPL